MRIIVIGTRGIPNFQGGVETHCEELYPRLASMNYDILLVRRSCYIPEDDYLTEYNGVNQRPVYSPENNVELCFIPSATARRGTDIFTHAIDLQL
jgi:hypothetical protein